MLAGLDQDDGPDRGGTIPGLVSNGLTQSCTSLGSSSGSSDTGRGTHQTREAAGLMGGGGVTGNPLSETLPLIQSSPPRQIRRRGEWAGVPTPKKAPPPFTPPPPASTRTTRLRSGSTAPAFFSDAVLIS